MSYECGNCHGTFETTVHARECFTLAGILPLQVGVAPVPVKTPSRHVTFKRSSAMDTDKRARLRATPRQERFIETLRDERNVTHDIPNNMLEASRLIAELKKIDPLASQLHAAAQTPGPIVVQPPQPDPEPEFVPFNKVMLNKIPDGRYGVANNEMTQTVFIRKTDVPLNAKGNNARYAGAVKIQVKSSDTWSDAMIYWPSGGVSAYRKTLQGTDINEILTMIFMDIGGSAQNYADKFSECSNCGRELTDDKSRYFGLGSDCIQRRVDLVNYITSSKGPYVQGAATT